MAGLDALHQVVVVLRLHGVHQVDAGLVDGQHIQRSEDADVGRHHGGGVHTVAVAVNGHVAHHVHIADLVAEELQHGLGGLDHALHELLVADAPHVVAALGRVLHGLAHVPVGAADGDVLVRAAKAAAHMALEVREGEHGVILAQVAADAHLLEPLAAVQRPHGGAVLVEDVHGAEVPAVDLQRLAVALGGVAVAVIVGVGLHYDAAGDVLLDELLHPGAWDDVGPVGLAGVQLYRHLAREDAADALKGLDEAGGREVSGEKHDGLGAAALGIRDIVVPAGAGNRLIIGHVYSSLQASRKRLPPFF